MKKQTPETRQPVIPHDPETEASEDAFSRAGQEEFVGNPVVNYRDYFESQVEHRQKALSAGGVAVQAVGNEVVAGGMQGEDITLPDRETYPTESHHINVEASPSRASRVDVSID